MEPTDIAVCYTPPKLAKRWGVKAEKVIAFIRSGELRALDVSMHPGVGKPRFRITPEAVKDFETRRESQQTPPKPQKRSRAKESDEIDYFPA